MPKEQAGASSTNRYTTTATISSTPPRRLYRGGAPKNEEQNDKKDKQEVGLQATTEAWTISVQATAQGETEKSASSFLLLPPAEAHHQNQEYSHQYQKDERDHEPQNSKSDPLLQQERFTLVNEASLPLFQQERFILDEVSQEQPGVSPHHSRKVVPFFPAFPGALSTICSLLIMYLILHSKQKLSSVYHRIMFFMSSSDILSSLAMAFHTVPMPPHLPREDEFPEYVFATKRMGNTVTCNIQGFAYLFGVIALYNYNSMLCVYYACAIGFQMNDRRISRFVEPVCHFLVLMIALIYSIPPLFNELYNPSPTEMWCVVSFYPFNCYENEDVECIRGNADSPFLFNIVRGLAIGIALNFLIILVSLILVIGRVVIMDRSIAKYSRTCSEDMRYKLDDALAKNRLTKVVVLQALAYIMAFVLTNLFPFINFLTDESPLVTQAMTLVFLPLQGFFNFLIFIGHKVYNYRRVNPNLSRCEVVQKFLFSTVEEPMYISQLSRVEIERDSSNEDDGEEDHEEQDKNEEAKHVEDTMYPDIVLPPKAQEDRDLSAGDDVFMDENESRSKFSWMKNEDGVYSSSEPGVSSTGLSESRSSSRNTRNSSKSYMSYSLG